MRLLDQILPGVVACSWLVSVSVAQVTGACLGGDLFQLIGTSVNFSSAQSQCQGLGGSLASISSVEELAFVFSLTQNTLAWVGVDAIGVLPSGGNGDTSNFKFTDGTTDGVEFLHVANGQLPWSANNLQPDDTSGIEDCAHLTPQNGEGRFNDAPCSNTNAFVCRNRADPECAPSSIPTASPTNLPITFPPVLPPTSPAIDSCLGQDLFKFVLTFAEFNSAQEQCVGFGGNLASVTNIEELDHMFTLVQDRRAWIGIDAREAPAGGNGDASNFRFTDGTNDGASFFQVSFSEFPWASNEPNNLDGSEDCVEIFQEVQGGVRLADAECNNFNQFICRIRNDPQCGPILAPSNQPTASPTNLPITLPPVLPPPPPSENREACFEQDLFRFVNSPADFNTAKADCQAQGGNLTSISSKEENDLVFSLTRTTAAWIGVEGINNEESVDSTNFFFTDGSTETSFFLVENGAFPWGPGEPNEVSLQTSCVHVLFDGRWNDGDCPVPLPYVCRIVNDPICSAAVESNCLEDDRFNFVNFDTDFNRAAEFCDGSGGALASVTNELELSNIFSLTGDAFAWVGVDALGVRPSGGNGDPLNFKFTDGTTDALSFLHVTIGELPWGEGQPDGLNGDEDCVIISAEDPRGRLNDVTCSVTFSFVCRIKGDPNCSTTVPTASPSTIAPTASPLVFATSSPSFSPTNSPTNAQTVSPSSSPSKEPTSNPTSSPSETPPFPVAECVRRRLGVRRPFR